ncbi:MAG: SxtJ family membrane protein [Candidatus Pelagibacterales bacterium]
MYGGDIRIAFLCISFIFFLLGLINSSILTPLNKIWLLFGIILGNFVSPVILGVIFFAVVTPIGLTMRLLNKDLLNLKKNNNNTYWINKENSNSMKDQF